MTDSHEPTAIEWRSEPRNPSRRTYWTRDPYGEFTVPHHPDDDVVIGTDPSPDGTTAYVEARRGPAGQLQIIGEGRALAPPAVRVRASQQGGYIPPTSLTASGLQRRVSAAELAYATGRDRTLSHGAQEALRSIFTDREGLTPRDRRLAAEVRRHLDEVAAEWRRARSTRTYTAHVGVHVDLQPDSGSGELARGIGTAFLVAGAFLLLLVAITVAVW